MSVVGRGLRCRADAPAWHLQIMAAVLNYGEAGLRVVLWCDVWLAAWVLQPV